MMQDMQICVLILYLMINSGGNGMVPPTPPASNGERYKFMLFIPNLLDPSWVYSKHDEVTRIECAYLCYRNKEDCFYFGYKESTCYLLTDKVSLACTSKDCPNVDMKIYKWTEEFSLPEVSGVDGGGVEAPDKEYSCEPPDGAEGAVFCPQSTLLLRAMGSKSPFFNDALGATCSDMREQVYGDEEDIYTFFSPDGGLSLAAQCPKPDHVIVQFKLCVMDARIPAIKLHCNLLKDPDRMGDVYNATSDEMKHALVDCGEYGAVQRIIFAESGQDLITRVIFTCVRIDIPSIIPDAPGI